VEIVADEIEVAGAHGPLLRSTSLRVENGRTHLVPGVHGPGLTALALVLSGRLRPSSGRVLIDGRDDPKALRRTVAVVDAPEVTAPEDAVPVRDVVAEGLSLAGRRSGRRAVREWLESRGIEALAKQRAENLPPRVRTRLLVDLAVEPRQVAALVLDGPDRHGGDPQDWFALAQREADRGLAVVALCEPHAHGALAPAHQLSTADSNTGGAP
jgi:ABC-type multidrug transport system ATPase subunit